MFPEISETRVKAGEVMKALELGTPVRRSPNNQHLFATTIYFLKIITIDKMLFFFVSFRISWKRMNGRIGNANNGEELVVVSEYKLDNLIGHANTCHNEDPILPPGQLNCPRISRIIIIVPLVPQQQPIITIRSSGNRIIPQQKNLPLALQSKTSSTII